MHRKTILAVALLLICGTLWGAMPMLSKLAGETEPHPVGLSLLVNAIGAVLCASLCWSRGILRWPGAREWHFFLCWAILYSVLNQVLIYWLSVRLDATLVSVFTVLEGLVIFAVSALLRLEKPNMMRCCGLLTGLLGVLFLLFTVQNGNRVMPSLLFAAGFVIPLSYAAESLFIAVRRPLSVHPLLAVTFVMFCSLPFLFALAFASDDFMPMQFPPGRGEWVALAMAVSTILANLAFFTLIAIAGTVFAGQLSYFNAICGVGWGVVVLGEKMPWAMFVAVGFIMLGLLMVRPKSAAEQRTALADAQPCPAE